MAGIKQPIQDIIAALQAIPDLKYVRLYNNQLRHLRIIEQFQMPAAFVEMVTPEQFKTIGAGCEASDLHFRIHIVHNFLDAGDGTFDQDLTIYDLRDKVIAKLSQFNPTACSTLQKVSESPDQDHNNVVNYIIEFATHFIDTKGSNYDQAAGKYIYSTPPTDLQVNTTEVQSIAGVDNIPSRDFNV